MNTPDITTPLYQDGPSVDDLHADIIWKVQDDDIDDYLEQLGDGPDRKQVRRAEQRCEDPAWVLGLRADARHRAGLLPIMTNQQYLASPLAVTYSSDAAERVADHDYYNTRYGWPGHDRAPDPVAYTIHSDILEAVARVQRHRNFHDAIDRHRTPCVVCGDRVTNLTCDSCRPILQHARLIATAEQPIDGKRTRLDAALDYARNNR